MNALGLIEVIGYVAAIEAGDVCVKSANVNIVGLNKVGAGIVTLVVTGDVGAVKSAVEVADLAASKIGEVRSTHVIPRIHQDVSNILFENKEDKNIDKLDENKTQQLTNEKIIKSEDLIDVKSVGDEEKEEKPKAIKIEEENEQKVLEDKIVKEEITEETSEEISKQTSKETTLENDLQKKSVKELKALVKKYDYSITYRELNQLKKEEIINLVEKLKRKDK